MLRLSLFRSARFSAAVAALALGLFPLAGALFIVTQTLQFDLGFSPLEAGVPILPMAALIAVAAPLSAPAVRLVGSKLTAAAGLLAVAGGLWWAAAPRPPARPTATCCRRCCSSARAAGC